MLRYIVAWLTGRTDVAVRDVELHRDDGRAVPATVVRPRGHTGTLPAWVVLHGITRPGRAHPQLVRFSRALAATGAVVLVPEVPEWRELDLAPRLTAPTIRAALRGLETLTDVRQRNVGLVGFSFGAPHTLASLAEEDIASRAAGAVTFGGYCDLEPTVRFMFTGKHEHEGRTYRLRPDPYGRWIVAANYLTAVPGLEHARDVAAALRALAALAGDVGHPAWDHAYDAAKREARRRIHPSRRSLFDLVAPPSDREPDEGPAADLAKRLADAGARVDPDVDARPRLAKVRRPVRVLHGRFDHLIPFSEAYRMRAALPPDGDADVTVTRLFGHSRQDPLPSPGEAVREVPRFLGAMTRVFRLTDE